MLRLLFCGGILAMAQVSFGAGRMIAVDSSRALYEIDITTGAKTQFGSVSSNAGTTAGLAYDQLTGTVYLTSTGNDSVYKLDINTGTATLIGLYGDSAIVMHGLEYDDATGKLYGVSSHNNGLYDINKSTGVATLIGTSGLLSFTNIGYDVDNDQMYAANTTTPESFFKMDLSTGATTLIGALGAGVSNPNGLAYNRDNHRLYLIDNSTDMLYTVNLGTGAATLIGSTGSGNLLGLAYISEIPEPAMISMLAALVPLRRRRS